MTLPYAEGEQQVQASECGAFPKTRGHRHLMRHRSLPQKDACYESLLKHVDGALYQAKDSGRNRVNIWNQ